MQLTANNISQAVNSTHTQILKSTFSIVILTFCIKHTETLRNTLIYI